MKKKRICIDINSIIPLWHKGYLSGVGRTTLELMRALAAIKDELPFELLLYSQNIRGIKAADFGLPFDCKHIYLRNKPFYNRLLAASHLKEILFRYDLFHIPHNFGYAADLSKTILSLHDVLFMKMQEEVFNHHQMRKQIPSFARRVKTIITCSEYSKKDIVETMKLSPGKIHVIHWGCDRSIFYEQKDKQRVGEEITHRFGISKPYFLSVSCSMGRKNTQAIIDNYMALLTGGQTLNNDLYLVWDAPQVVKDKIGQSGYAHRIHFLPDVSDKELSLLYAGATATWFLSLYEGFGLPVLESMACGTPVIASRLTSLPEVGGDAAVYVDPFDNRKIRELMLAFDREKINRPALIDKGLRRADCFSWDKCARETIEIYEQCLR